MWKRAGKDLTPMVGLDMGWLCRTDPIHVPAFWGFIKNQFLCTPQRASCARWELPGTILPQQCGICPWMLWLGQGSNRTGGKIWGFHHMGQLLLCPRELEEFPFPFLSPIPMSLGGTRGCRDSLAANVAQTLHLPLPLPWENHPSQGCLSFLPVYLLHLSEGRVKSQHNL